MRKSRIYRCFDCGHVFKESKFVKLANKHNQDIKCPKCGSKNTYKIR